MSDDDKNSPATARLHELEDEVARLSAELMSLRRNELRDGDLLRDARRRLEDAHGREAILLSSLGSQAGGSQTAPDLPEGDGEGRRVDPALLKDLFMARPTLGWQDPGWGLTPLSVPPGLGNYGNLGATQVSLGVSLLGLDGAGRRRVVELFVARQRHDRQTAPLFLTDHDDFTLLRKERFAFEYLPPFPGPDCGLDEKAWNDYLRRRLTLIWHKWDLKRILSFDGQAA